MLKDPGSASRLLGLAAAVASALLLFVAGEPIGAGAVAWIALIPLLVAVLRERRAVWSWIYGLVFGLAFFGLHLSWIFIFGWMAWTALTAVMSLYLSAATFVAGLVRRTALAPLFVAGAWGGMEAVRDRWPFGGYPWGTIGTTQASVPGVRWLAAIVGVYGLTLLVVFVAAIVAHRLVSGGWSLRSIAIIGCALAVFIAVDAVWFGPPPAGRPKRVLVVQGGVPRPARPNQRDVILDAHIRLTRSVFAQRRARTEPKPDLVVWAEDAIGIGVRESAERDVSALARSLRTPMLVGRSVLVGDEGFNNTVESVTAQGTRNGVYVKRHPVPFGEYVPIPFFRRFVSTLQEEIPYDLKTGSAATVFDVDGTKVATPICFESVFPRDTLDFARKGAEFYVISTNNASFEHSYAGQQHLAHARMRALETRQFVVQDALSGISATLTPGGRVLHETRLFTTAAFVTTIQARQAHSLYARTGDLFVYGLAIATLVGAVIAYRRRSE